MPPKTNAEVVREELYAFIGKEIREARTLVQLADVWLKAQADIKLLPVDWRASLTIDKDRRKAKLQPQIQGAVANE